MKNSDEQRKVPKQLGITVAVFCPASLAIRTADRAHEGWSARCASKSQRSALTAAALRIASSECSSKKHARQATLGCRRQKSDAELRFHLEHDRWPDDGELPESGSGSNEMEE